MLIDSGSWLELNATPDSNTIPNQSLDQQIAEPSTYQPKGNEMEYTAVIKQQGDWWIGWVEEVPGVNCQERTHTALRQSLAETLSEALEFNRRDARAAAGESYLEEKVVLNEAV